jgi:starch phosphorylase
MQQKGTYNPQQRYENDPAIKEVMDSFASDRFCPNEHGLFRWIFDELVHRGDRYFHIADFPAYVETQQLIDGEYLNEDIWWRKAVLNVARIGKFSSDRSITQYARDIWRIGQFERSARPTKPPVRSAAVVSGNGAAPAASEPAVETESKHVAD